MLAVGGSTSFSSDTMDSITEQDLVDHCVIVGPQSSSNSSHSIPEPSLEIEVSQPHPEPEESPPPPPLPPPTRIVYSHSARLGGQLVTLLTHSPVPDSGGGDGGHTHTHYTTSEPSHRLLVVVPSNGGGGSGNPGIPRTKPGQLSHHPTVLVHSSPSSQQSQQQQSSNLLLDHLGQIEEGDPRDLTTTPEDLSQHPKQAAALLTVIVPPSHHSHSHHHLKEEQVDHSLDDEEEEELQEEHLHQEEESDYHTHSQQEEDEQLLHLHEEHLQEEEVIGQEEPEEEQDNMICDGSEFRMSSLHHSHQHHHHTHHPGHSHGHHPTHTTHHIDHHGQVVTVVGYHPPLNGRLSPGEPNSSSTTYSPSSGGGGGGVSTNGGQYATLTPLQPLPPISTMTDKFSYQSSYGHHGGVPHSHHGSHHHNGLYSSGGGQEGGSGTPTHYTVDGVGVVKLSLSPAPVSNTSGGGGGGGHYSPHHQLSPPSSSTTSYHHHSHSGVSNGCGAGSPKELSPSGGGGYSDFGRRGRSESPQDKCHGGGGGHSLNVVTFTTASSTLISNNGLSPHHHSSNSQASPPLTAVVVAHRDANSPSLLHVHTSKSHNCATISTPAGSGGSTASSSAGSVSGGPGGGAASSSGGGELEEINTKELAARISAELKRYSIPQAIFAQRVLCRSQGTLSDLLRNPKPWSKLKSGRETFRRMWKWLQEPEFQRMSALRLAGKQSSTSCGYSSSSGGGGGGGSLSSGGGGGGGEGMVMGPPPPSSSSTGVSPTSSGPLSSSYAQDHPFDIDPQSSSSNNYYLGPLPSSSPIVGAHSNLVAVRGGHSNLLSSPSGGPLLPLNNTNLPHNGLNNHACKRKEDTTSTEHAPTPKKPRLVFTDLQRRTLQAIFKETKRPSKEMQVTIARQLGLEPTTVGNFFMNARRRSMDKWKEENEPSPQSNSSTPNGLHNPSGESGGGDHDHPHDPDDDLIHQHEHEHEGL